MTQHNRFHFPPQTTTETLRLRKGDLVEVRSKEEILSTLDKDRQFGFKHKLIAAADGDCPLVSRERKLGRNFSIPLTFFSQAET